MYEYLKSLHLIFVITWFAGLFYIVRLFVYQIEANEMPSPEKEILQKQYKIMTYRLWNIITWPSAVLATIFALSLLHLNPAFLEMPWMQVKLGFVVLFFIYHYYTVLSTSTNGIPTHTHVSIGICYLFIGIS